ncbi:MAG: SusC/RagA family TonB-linked outer membrane protein [Bacteroidota bacterium]|nr:SusC/RagA family TonB-linked outer membrane protein [Bacteroidota bacterium]
MKKTILFIVLAALCLNFTAVAQINTPPKNQQVHGKVTDEQGKPLAGATVKLKSGNLATSTDNDGKFDLRNLPLKGILMVSFISFQSVEFPIPLNSSNEIIIQLKADGNSLNEVQVIGYGTTTKRLNTGSVSIVSAIDLEKQPVTNVLSALSGRMPGVLVQTTNGLPGGNINIQIRGQGSISAGTNPLYVIDGVPFATTLGTLTGSQSILATSSINGIVSPFNSLNPDDIESISILKDADATAIYGSRGSNGVVLITTKQGKAGKTKVEVQVNQGIDRAANLPQVLSLQQYLQMRREAYANDGIAPSNDPTSFNYAPDLTTWSQTQSTNWPNYLLGNTGHTTGARATVSGGDENTNFVAGGNFHSETTILPGDNLYQRGGFHSSIQHTTKNKKFYFQFSNSLTLDNNKLSDPTTNLIGDLLMPPNYPIYNVNGSLNWSLSNPYGDVQATSMATSSNLIANTLIRYEIFPGLNVKVSSGYNEITIKQTELFPTVALYPGSINYTNFGDNSSKSFIVEPQIEYKHQFTLSTLNLLAGGTYQNSNSNGSSIVANGFTNTSLMQNIGSASTYYLSNNYIAYKYFSLFGRATYDYNDKYIVNFSVRRDGSSKFGPGNRFGTFGALGGAWLFSNENFIKNNLSFLSFGKLRASYGITGNDQITPYQYLSTYSSSGYVYNGISGLKPTRIANSDFHWETTHKLEMAVDLGFFKDRILIDIDRYQNRSKDQLVNYTIPTLTGFSSYQANLPAVVENKGWEFDLTTKNIQNKEFSWTTTFNLTIPQNRLLSFQNLAASSYSNTLVIGQPITRAYGFKFLYIDQKTGVPVYTTASGGTTQSPSYDTDAYFTIGSGMPNFYGGIGNSFRYKSFQLDVFGQFTKQYSMGSLLYTPGNQIFNNYEYVANRWQSTVNTSNVPKASTSYDFYYTSSSANYFNASYFRIKNVALSYDFPGKWLSQIKVEKLRIYLQGQNLLTLWNKNIPLLDPESGNLTASQTNLPPLKTFIVGLQFTL